MNYIPEKITIQLDIWTMDSTHYLALFASYVVDEEVKRVINYDFYIIEQDIFECHRAPAVY